MISVHTPGLHTLPVLSVLEGFQHPAFIFPFDRAITIDSRPAWSNAAYRAVEGEIYGRREGGVKDSTSGDQVHLPLVAWLRVLASELAACVLTLHLGKARTRTLHLNGQIETDGQQSWIVVIGFSVEERTRETSASNTNTVSQVSALEPIPNVQPTLVNTLALQGKSGILSFSPTLPTSPCGILLLDTDWGSTPLGPISQWSQSLRTAVSIMMSSPTQSYILWGESHTILYNDAYKAVAGDNHPWLFGQSGSVGLAEIWDNFEPHITRVMQGIPFAIKDDRLFIKQEDGKLMETYCSWSYSPCAGAIDGTVDGMINHQSDTTQGVLLTRRMKSMRLVGEEMGRSTTTLELFQDAAQSLSHNEEDFPFLLFYKGRVDEVTRKVSLSLAASIGVPEDHQLAPKHVSIDGTRDPTQIIPGDVWPFHAVLACGGPIHLHTLPPGVQDFERRGFGDVVSEAVAIPITAGPDAESGVLIFGLNTRTSYDSLYEEFLRILGHSMSAALGAATLLETQIQRSEDLRILDQVKTAVFENTSHELRTPLLLIAGPCNDALADLKDPLSGPNRSRLKLIQRATARLLRLVNTIMSFSSAQAGRLNTTFHPVRLAAWVVDLASLFRSAIERSGVDLHVHADVDDPRIAWVDIPSFEKIVFNLLSNAFKYTKEGEITVSLTFTDKTVQLSVQDTGCGIPEGDLDRVLERFHRVRSVEGSRSMEGTGIGLALCHSLVKLHSGTLELTSELGVGSSFYVSLPLGSDHLPIDNIDASGSDPALLVDRSYGKGIIDEAKGWLAGEEDGFTDATSEQSGSVNEHMKTFPNAKILLVEDSPDARAYIRSLLSLFCKTVIVKKDGQAALEYLQNKSNERVDMVLSDIMMPRLSGDELLRFIREDPDGRLNTLPVILMSARAGDEASSDGLSSGATDYLAKPFTSRELIARVSTRLRQAGVQAALEVRIREGTLDLAESEARYRRITEASPVGVFEMDMDGSTITYANPTFFVLAGLEGRTFPLPYSVLFETMKQEGDWKAALQEQEAAIHARESFTYEWEWRKKSLGWAFGEVKPIAAGYLGTITNTTSAKLFSQAQIEASKAQVAQAEEQRRALEAFIDIISHELRGPCSAILQGADLLTRSAQRLGTLFGELDGLTCDLPPGKREAVAALLREGQKEVEECRETSQSVTLCAQHQSIITTDVLSVSRLKHGLDVTRVDFPLVSMLNNVLVMFSGQASEHGIALSLEVDDSIDKLLVIHADPTRLVQILVNLVSNACRALETWGGSSRSITISVSVTKDRPQTADNSPLVEDKLDPTTVWFVASVRDSGPGIPASLHANLFTKFNDSVPENHGGRRGGGLGLYLVKKLVEMQNGTISVQSDGGETGTTFRFHIRAQIAQIAPITPAKADRDASLPTARSGSVVLIVEDSKVNQMLLQRQLMKAGYKTVVANNGLEGLSYLEASIAKGYPAAVTCDLEMPILGGLECVSRVRDMETSGRLPGHLPFICVTGNARQGQIDAALHAGMDRVLVKPYKIREVVGLLDSLISENKPTLPSAPSHSTPKVLPKPNVAKTPLQAFLIDSNGA